jgi:hypothetical protein
LNLITVRVLWASLVFSTLLELAFVLGADFDRHVELQLPVVVALACVALGVAVTSFLLPSRLHRIALEQLALPVVEVLVQNSEAMSDYRSAAGSQRVFRDAVAARTGMLRAFQTPFILSLALSESIALMGLVIAQGRLAPSWLALPFFAIAWVLFGLRFPREKSLVAPAERLYSARLAGCRRRPW